MRYRHRFRSFSAAALICAAGASIGCGGPAEPANSPDPALTDDADDADPQDAVPASNAKVQEGMDAIQAGDFEAAKTALTAAVEADPDDPQAKFYLGVALESLGDSEGAKTNYRAALELDPKLVEAAANFSGLLIDAEDADGALEVIEPALKHAPQHPGLLMNRAAALDIKGDKPAALKAHADAVAVAPDNAQLRAAYGQLLMDAGENEKALKQLKQALGAKDQRVLASIAQSFSRLKAFKDCVKALDKAIAVKAAPGLLVRRAACRHFDKDDAGALADYQAAIKLAPEQAAGHFYLGRHLAATGKKAEAKKSLKKAAELGKGTPLAAKATELIKKLK